MNPGSPGRLPVRFEQLGRMPPAEPVPPLEALAKPDVEDALGDDRVQGRALGSSPDGTHGAAPELHRRGQPDVDEVAGRGAPPVPRGPVTPAPARPRSRMDRRIGSGRRPTPTR